MEADAQKGEHAQFDVVADGRTIFSKYDTGRFPEEDEILDLLR